MPLPPPGDHQRPLILSVRLCRILALCFLTFGGLALLAFVIRLGGRITPRFIPLIGAYFIPGCLYLVCAIYLKHRQRWAIIVAIITTGLLLLGNIYGLLMFLLFNFDELPNRPFLLLPLMFLLILATIFTTLVFTLGKSFEALRHAPDQSRGFSPIMPPPL